MGERMFGGGAWEQADARATGRAAELAEQLLDEIARANHDWRLIARLAADVLRLASAIAERTRASPPRPPEADR